MMPRCLDLVTYTWKMVYNNKWWNCMITSSLVHVRTVVVVYVEILQGEIFANCCHWWKFITSFCPVCVSDYLKNMATFTTLAKEFCTKTFLVKFLSSENFHIIYGTCTIYMYMYLSCRFVWSMFWSGLSTNGLPWLSERYRTDHGEH